MVPSLVTSLSLSLSLAVAAGGEPVVLKLGTLAPSGSAWHEALKDMASRWETASAGQWVRVGTVAFFCTAPYPTPAELAKARVFAAEGDPGTVNAWRAAGFHPVVLSSIDLVPALGTGMIDCAGNVPLFMLTTRAFEKARYLIDLPWGFVVAVTVVKKEAWERVPADLRPRLLAIAAELGSTIDASARQLERDALEAMKARGLVTVPASLEAWRPALERAWPVLRREVVPAAFFDEVVRARDACRATAGTRHERG